jgi:hypothetical protein
VCTCGELIISTAEADKTAREVRFLPRFVPETAFDKGLRKQDNLPV